MKNVKPGVLLLSLLAAVVAVPAAADDRGLYLGGSAGYAWYKDSCKGLTLPCGNVDPAGRAFAGYQFNRNVALELGWAHLGKVRAGGGADSLTKETSGFDLVGVFGGQLSGGLWAFGKLGAYRMRTELEVIEAGVVDTEGQTNTAFSYGLGLEYRMGFLGIRAEWQRWDSVGGGNTGKDDIDVATLGLLIRF